MLVIPSGRRAAIEFYAPRVAISGRRAAVAFGPIDTGPEIPDPEIVGDLAAKIPVVLASRAMTGPVFTRTYGYPGSEIDLIQRGVVPAGYLSGLKARLLLGLVMRGGGKGGKVAEAFAPYQ